MIIGKAKRIREEGNERISWGGNCAKNIVLKINLNCSATASRSKWKKNIERVKEDTWGCDSDGSKNEEGRVGSSWVSDGGKDREKEGLEKLAIEWDGKVRARQKH